VKYTFFCHEHGTFEVDYPMQEGPPPTVPCTCGEVCSRDYKADHTQEVIYNGQGFERTDNWKQNPGKGQSYDKREWLNSNWSKHYGEPPPKPDSKGSYDGT
jgi:hypothetical protein